MNLDAFLFIKVISRRAPSQKGTTMNL